MLKMKLSQTGLTIQQYSFYMHVSVPVETVPSLVYVRIMLLGGWNLRTSGRVQYKPA